MDNSKYTTINRAGVGEFVRMMDNDLNPILTSPTLSTVRTHTSPLMGTYARAAKRRIDSESGPIRIEGTDTLNQPMQHIYQNSRHVTNDQPNQLESRRLANIQSNNFDDRSRFPSTNYDLPPRKEQQPSVPPAQKIITTITTTTTTAPAKQYQSTASLNEAPSPVDRLLEQAVELQKLNNNPNSSKEPLVIERKEQYQVFLNSTDREGQSTSTNSRARSAHATDLDQAQVDRFVDDHQAIQHLTRALQEHNTSALNEYKRLPSQTAPIVINTTTTTTRIPSSLMLIDKTNQPPTSEFTVIDALLHNPLGTNNPKQNSKLQIRFNNILTNLRNAEYVNALKESTRKVTKKKKSKKSSKGTKGPAVDKQTQITEAMIDPILVTTEQTPLINSEEQKKRSRIGSKNGNYQVVDAVISSPISYRLPDAYLTKYRANPPFPQSSLASSITGKNDNILLSQQADSKANNETANGLVKVVNDLTLHHAAALSTTNNLQQTNKSGYPHQISSIGSTGTVNQASELVKPRILYRYIDEHGNVLKISPIGPSQLREIVPENSQKIPPRTIEPTYVNNRTRVVEDERHYPFHDQRSGWSNGSKTPNTISRDDFESSDKRPIKAHEQSSSTSRTIPISIERDYPPRFPSSHAQGFNLPHSNQENIQTSWLPRSQKKSEPLHSPTSGQADYETDSTDSEHSTSYPSHEYPQRSQRHHRSAHQSAHQQNRSPVRPYDPSPSRLAHGNRRISPDFTRVHTPRNYIEIFRDGDVKPSEIYSLPFNDSSSTSDYHSPHDQHQTTSISPTSKYAKIIPSLSSHDPRTSQHSPNRATPYHDSYPPTTKSDYRPLRTKLQREYKITPSLLVDEWDLPETPTSPDQHNQPSLSAPDDVFMTTTTTTTNRLHKA